MKRAAKLAWLEACLLTEVTTEIRAVDKSQVVRDLFYFQFGVRQLPLCFANDAFVDDGRWRLAYVFQGPSGGWKAGRKPLLVQPPAFQRSLASA